MILIEFPLQTAIYTALNGVVNAPVYDEVPDDTEYPYVEIGNIITSSFNGKSCIGHEATVLLHFWHSAGDVGGTNSIIDSLGNEVLAALTVTDDDAFTPLTLPNHTIIRQDTDGMDYTKNINLAFRHGIMTFVFLADEK